MDPAVNFGKFKRSNKPITAGDIFTYKMPNGKHLFGRVVLANYEGGPMPSGSLLYFYKQQRDTPEPDLSQMTIDDLIIDPVWTNRLGWARGYFFTIANKQLSKNELPKVHCFYWNMTKQYVDQDRNVLPERTEPCGNWGLVSYRWVDDHISDALGIPRVPIVEE